MERILVVDDEIEICNVLKEYLTEKGYEVHTSQDGKSAIQKVKEISPHIVLLDMKMPGMSGIETLQEIKKIDPDIGVIMVTAVGDENLARQTFELGAVDFICKPVDFNYLETVVMVKLVDLLG